MSRIASLLQTDDNHQATNYPDITITVSVYSSAQKLYKM
jgi:hypothetical protein